MAKIETSRVTVNMPKGLLMDVDLYAESMNINRTAAISVLLSQAIKGQQFQADIKQLMSMAGGIENDDK